MEREENGKMKLTWRKKRGMLYATFGVYELYMFKAQHIKGCYCLQICNDGGVLYDCYHPVLKELKALAKLMMKGIMVE